MLIQREWLQRIPEAVEVSNYNEEIHNKQQILDNIHRKLLQTRIKARAFVNFVDMTRNFWILISLLVILLAMLLADVWSPRPRAQLKSLATQKILSQVQNAHLCASKWTDTNA